MESFAVARPVASPLLFRHRPSHRLSPPDAAFPLPLSPHPISVLHHHNHLRRLSFIPRRKPFLSPIRSSSSSSPNPNTHPPPSPPPPAVEAPQASPPLPAVDAPEPLGVKPIPLAISVGIGLAVRFLVPRPAEVSPQAWQLLAIFLSTIAGLVFSPLPVGAWAFIGLTTSVLTNTLTFNAAFGAFTNEVIWLIVISFFFARGFVKTGLGDRIATYFVKLLGRSTLGLSYGLTFSEALIAPAMPSTTARAGGVFLPIVKSLSLSAGSKPGDQSARKIGSYLIMSQFQSAGNSSALFLTAAAQNLLCLKLAEELGIKIASPWVSWFKAASLPAFVALLATPFVLYKIFPPEIKDTPEAPALAAKKLEEMGPMTRNEWTMVGTMALAVVLWVFGLLNDYNTSFCPLI